MGNHDELILQPRDFMHGSAFKELVAEIRALEAMSEDEVKEYYMTFGDPPQEDIDEYYRELDESRGRRE